MCYGRSKLFVLKLCYYCNIEQSQLILHDKTGNTYNTQNVPSEPSVLLHTQ